MRRAVFAAVVAACAVFALAGAADSTGQRDAFAAIDRAGGELPKNVVPSSYTIDLDPDRAHDRIDADERIVVTVRRPAGAIVLDALQIAFRSAQLDGIAARVSLDPKRQTATLHFAAPVAPGVHTLAISYRAKLQHSDQGLFVQPYTDDAGKPAYLYATQLEPTDARRVFPSFDEPAFKARFTISFVVPRSFTAVSNMPVIAQTPMGSLKRVRFAATPPMSTYLVALAAGEFDAVHAVSDGIRLGVYATRGKRAAEQYALGVMQRLMPYFDSYYGIKYPLPKLDSIAIPGDFDGAMENWGAITYVEDELLFDPRAQPDSDKRDIVDVTAHETSHQWNGDLTTMAWWDELWLNEGFATWMETKATDYLHPHWEYYLKADADANDAMESDDLLGTHPVFVPVRNEEDADAVFDEISYTKAGAVLRMLERYLGQDVFRAGLRRYFAAHAYGIGSAADLWRELSRASGRDVAAIARAWIYAPGFPAIAVSAACNGDRRTLRLSQQRYLFDPATPAGATVWQIPLNLQLDARSGVGTSVLMREPTLSVDGGRCGDPLVVNGDGVGYFRVRYDAATQAAQQAAFAALPPADRLNLLDDGWAFVESGRTPLTQYLAYARADAMDRDPNVVEPILDKYTLLLEIERGHSGEAALKSYLAAALRPLAERFGGWSGAGASSAGLHARNRILELLATCDDAATIAQGKQRFARLETNPDAFSPPDRDAIARVAGYAADRDIYDGLVALATHATDQSERENYAFAAFGAADGELAEQSLQASLHLPEQFAGYAPFVVEEVARRHPQLAWRFMQEHADRLFGAMSSFDRAAELGAVAGDFGASVPYGEIAAFLRAKLPPDAAMELTHALEKVRSKERLSALLLPQIDALLASKNAGAVVDRVVRP